MLTLQFSYAMGLAPIEGIKVTKVTKVIKVTKENMRSVILAMAALVLVIHDIIM